VPAAAVLLTRSAVSIGHIRGLQHKTHGRNTELAARNTKFAVCNTALAVRVTRFEIPVMRTATFVLHAFPSEGSRGAEGRVKGVRSDSEEEVTAALRREAEPDREP
jgi:hypothetical protein